MNKDYFYLTYHQVMAFMYRLDEMEKENPNFHDYIAKEFRGYVIRRATEIRRTYPQIKLKIIPNANKYQVSQSMLDYLTRLTGIDVLDRETVKRYIPLIDEVEERAKALVLNSNPLENKSKPI